MKSRSISAIDRSIHSPHIGSPVASRKICAVTIRIIGIASPFKTRVAGMTFGSNRPGVV